MFKIKVEPYVPDEDYDNPAMVTDFYEFSMANCLFLHGYQDTVMVFDMFFRENPDNLGYSISCGQHQLTKFLLNYHFTAKDLLWLSTKGMSKEFLSYLKDYKWKGDMYSFKEGTVCYPQVPMVRIECDMVGAILIETYLLQTMNFHSLIATKATRISGLATHTPRKVMEFGTRRAQGEDAGNTGVMSKPLERLPIHSLSSSLVNMKPLKLLQRLILIISLCFLTPTISSNPVFLILSD